MEYIIKKLSQKKNNTFNHGTVISLLFYDFERLITIDDRLYI